MHSVQESKQEVINMPSFLEKKKKKKKKEAENLLKVSSPLYGQIIEKVSLAVSETFCFTQPPIANQKTTHNCYVTSRIKNVKFIAPDERGTRKIVFLISL